MLRIYILMGTFIFNSLYLTATTPTYRTFLNQDALAACVQTKYGKDWKSLSLTEKQRIQRALNKEPALVIECELLFSTGTLQRYNQRMKSNAKEAKENHP